jgi:uncharacterized protein involved in type VI secretion and phage assembly
MPETQDNKRTKINTVLDDNPQFKKPGADPLLLTMVQGSEAISASYYMDVVMYAERRLEIDPKLMINTPATVSVRVEDRGGIRHQPEVFTFSYQKRKGVFQTFIKQDRFHRRIGQDFNVYAGRIVPAFQIMDQEVRYRIFEAPTTTDGRNMTFQDILKKCVANFKPIDLSTNYFDLTNVALDKLAKMEHCVQYGESTFNFLSRLMARYSIWYFYSHDGDGPHEKMFLGTGHAPKNDGRFPKCSDDLFKNFPDRRDIENKVLVEDWQFITGMSRVYTPAPRRVRTGDFNTVISTQPPQSTDSNQTFVSADFDIIQPAEAKPETNYIQESFPDSTIYTDEDATEDATTALEIAEGQVFTISAVSKNPTFGAGKRFEYEGGSEDNVTTTQQLITRMTFNAYDRDYLFIVSRKAGFGLAALLDDLLVQPGASFVAQFGSGKAPDFATAMAAAGLQEAINNSYENAWSDAHATAAQIANTKYLPPTPTFGTYFAAGMAGYISAFLPNATTVLQDLLPVFQGAVEVVGRTLEVIIQTVLIIPTIISLVVGNNLARDIHNSFNTIINSIEAFLKHLLNAADVDAYSSCFVASPLDKSAIGIPLPGGRISQIFGPHLATVIGKDGIDISPGEIFADKVGRVRVRFPWDREPGDLFVTNKLTDPSAKDQYLQGSNTAWLRVSDAWAGQRQFGSQFLPRVGDEVIVSFIDSDPDRPIITSRVYNSFNTDSNLPLPNENDKSKIAIDNMNSLRKLEGAYDNWSQSGIRTRILKQDGQNRKYHLLRFDDNPDHMQYLLRSQGRLDITALQKRYESISSDRHLTVGGKRPPPPGPRHIGGDYIAKIFRHYHLHVGDPDFATESGNRITKIEQNEELNVVNDSSQMIGGNWNTQVGGIDAPTAQVTINAVSPMGTILLNAMANITLSVGACSIVITPVGISITAPEINLVGQAAGLTPVAPAGAVALPPAIPIPFGIRAPTDPTPADPGDTFQQSK